MSDYEIILEIVSNEVRILLFGASDEFKKEWDGYIYFPTNENNKVIGPALNETAFDLLDERCRKELKRIKETYFD